MLDIYNSQPHVPRKPVTCAHGKIQCNSRFRPHWIKCVCEPCELCEKDVEVTEVQVSEIIVTKEPDVIVETAVTSVTTCQHNVRSDDSIACEVCQYTKRTGIDVEE